MEGKEGLYKWWYIPQFFYFSTKSTLAGTTGNGPGNVRNRNSWEFFTDLRICSARPRWLTHPQSSNEKSPGMYIIKWLGYFPLSSLQWLCSKNFAGFAQVMENLESHGICYFNFQAWKVNLSEGHGKSWKSNMLGRQMF